MKNQDHKKKSWNKPVINILSIKKDTFGGTGYGAENDSKSPNPPAKS